MANQKRLRIGLMGLGQRGKAHMPTILGLENLFEVAAICDINPATAQAMADKFDVKAYSDIGEFFEREHMDVVDIVTLPDTHHLMAKIAADHGVNLLIETPLATTRAMMDYIVDVTSRAGVRVEVAENYWRRPQQRLNCMAIEAGLIGTVQRAASYYEMGGVAEMQYHAMNLLRTYAGSDGAGAEVHAFEQRTPLAPFANDRGVVLDRELWNLSLITYSNGVLGSNTQLSTWNSPLRRSVPKSVTIEGTLGLINAGRNVVNAIYRLENGKEVCYPMQTESRQVGQSQVPVRYFYETDPPVEFVNPFADRPLGYGVTSYGPDDDISRAHELTSIYNSIVDGTPPEYGLAEGRMDQELSIAVNESARLGGQAIRLPLGEETAWERAQHDAFRARWGGDPIRDADAVIQRILKGS